MHELCGRSLQLHPIRHCLLGVRGRKGELDYRSDVREHMYELHWIILDYRRLSFMHAVCSRSLQLHPIRHILRNLLSMRRRKSELDYRSDVGEHVYFLQLWLFF